MFVCLYISLKINIKNNIIKETNMQSLLQQAPSASQLRILATMYCKVNCNLDSFDTNEAF